MSSEHFLLLGAGINDNFDVRILLFQELHMSSNQVYPESTAMHIKKTLHEKDTAWEKDAACKKGETKKEPVHKGPVPGRVYRSKCRNSPASELTSPTFLHMTQASSPAISSGRNTSSKRSAVRKPRATQASFREILSAKAFFTVLAAFSYPM